MKIFQYALILFAITASLLIGGFTTSAFAQSNAQNPLEEYGTRDPELETKASKNVEVAKYYLAQKKYKQSISRLVEIVEIYPQYSRFDQVLFYLAESYLANGELDEAKNRYGELIEKFPESELFKKAGKQLKKVEEKQKQAKG